VAGLREMFTDIPQALYVELFKREWVVNCKRPFMGPQQVIEYLGRYTHKIAISNHRIKSIEKNKISFTYKDYADGSKQKLMTLEAKEFLRRFCMHILPQGFRKIRHYGFLANRAKHQLKMQQMKMGIIQSTCEKKNWKQIAREKLSFDADPCPCCKNGKMQTIMHFEAHGPPSYFMKKIKEQNLTL
jgi:hypothetical protein